MAVSAFLILCHKGWEMIIFAVLPKFCSYLDSCAALLPVCLGEAENFVVWFARFLSTRKMRCSR